MERELNILQIKLLQMMDWLHYFCVDNRICYYALGGTMLGAIRHEGFIPWDDDIDIGMPRSDYNRFIELIGNKVVDNYFLETPESESFEFRYPYSKLYDMKTSLIENTWPKLKRGIFIDIFPLDGFGNTEEECLGNWAIVSNKTNFIWARMCALRKQRSLKKNVAIIIAHFIPRFIAKDKQRLIQINKLASKLDFNSTLYGGNTFGNWGRKEIMLSSIFGKPTLYKFENLTIYGVEKYNEYLTQMYGNWKQLPPVGKRVSHHDFIQFNPSIPYKQTEGEC